MLNISSKKNDDVEREFRKAEERFKNYPPEDNLSLDLWRILVLLTIIVRYFTASFSFLILQNVDAKLVIFIMTLDAIYLLDYILCIINYFWNRFQFRTRTKSELIIDFFVSFPYSYFYKFFSYDSYNHAIFLSLRSILILHMYHLVFFFKEKWNSAGTNHLKYFAIQCILYFFMILHGMTCLWYYVASDTWSQANEFQNKYQLIPEQYIICFYFILENFANRSFGDFAPADMGERVFVIVSVCVGFVLATGIFTATLSFLLDTKHKRRSELKMQYRHVLDHLKSIPTNQINNHKSYYKILWEKKRGVHEAKQFSLLPDPLRCVISVDLNIGFLHSCALFSDKPDAFLRMLSMLMRHEFYQAGQLISHRDVVNDKMIFVAFGALEILTENGESAVRTLTPGAFIGESALILALPAKSSVRTARYSELQVLYRRDFFTVLDKFPQVYAAIREEILERVWRSQNLKHLETVELNPFVTNQKRGYSVRKKSFPWIIRSSSLMRQFWELFIIVVALFVGITYPYFVVFRKTVPNWFGLVSSFVDVVLVLDVYVILTTAIECGKDTTETFLKITRKRLTQLGFYVDFVSCLKLELFYWIWTKNKRFKDILLLNRILKIYHIPKFIRTLEDRIELNFYCLRIAKHVFYLIFSVYWFSCLLYLTTCFEELCTEDGWFFKKVVKDLDGYTSQELLTTIYYSLSSLSGLAVGDIVPTNLTDKIVTCAGMIFGLCATSCCVAQLSTTIIHKRRLKTDFNEVLFTFQHFLERKGVHGNLIGRVKDYFTLQWYHSKNQILKSSSIFYNVPKIMQTQMSIDETMEAIKSVSLFQDQSLNFLVEIATKTKILILPPNELIVCKGEISKILYIIEKGYCIRQFVLGPHSFFEPICFFTNINSLCTVKTLTHVKLLCIDEETFWGSAAPFPTVMKHFSETSEVFDLVEEFKKFPVRASINEIISLKEENIVFEGSFVNVISFCKNRNESYSRPFRRMGPLCLMQVLLLPFCILPYGFFLKFWMTMRLVVAIVVATLTPYQIIQNPYTPVLDKILLTADVVAYMDLYVMMFVGYYKSKNQLVIHPLKTASHYLGGKFVFDFLLCIPWQLVTGYFTHNETLHNAVRIVKVGQIYRLLQFFNHMTDIKKKINSNILQILKYFPVMFIAANFWSAFLVVNESSRKSWTNKNETYFTTDQVYITALYVCTEIFTSCGFGDFPPTYTSTLILTILINLSGVVFFGYIYASISSHKAYWYSFLFKYQETVRELKQFMVQENVHEQLQQQIIKRIKYGWNRNRGIDPNRILSKLHATLYEDTVYEMFQTTLRQVSVFEHIERPILRMFAKLITERYYLRSETIYEFDDVIFEMCIIQNGNVKVTSKDNDLEMIIGAGGIFGNLTRYSKHKISITVMAVDNADVLCMKTKDFWQLTQKYTSMEQEIENKMRDRDFIPSASTDLIENQPSDIQLYDFDKRSPSKSRLQKLTTNITQLFLICLPWKLFRITIPPHSLTYKIIDNYCLILTYLSTIVTTYEFAFQHHVSFFLEFSVYVDFTIISKIVLEMHKSFEDSNGETVTSNKKILSHYYQNQKVRRILDVFVNCPFYYVVFFVLLFTDSDFFFLFSILRMLTLFRLTYLFEYYNEKSNQLMTNLLAIKISYMIIWSTLLIHFFACGWYFLACPLDSCFEDSWISKMSNNSLDKFHIYVTCIYFVVTTITTTAPGDVTPNNTCEHIYTIVLMMTSVFLIGIFIGEIWNLLNSTLMAQIRYENRINELKDYLKRCNLSEFQLKKTWRYVKQLWAISNGNQIPRGVSYLHSNTFHKLMNEIYGDHIRRTYVFSEVEHAFVRQLCQYLKRNIYIPGNYIVQHGDFDASMYFIHYGEVDILTVHSNLTETVHEVLRGGDTFGILQGLFPKVPQHFSYRARTTVHVLVLQLRDWGHLLNFFPESKNSIFSKTSTVHFW